MDNSTLKYLEITVSYPERIALRGEHVTSVSLDDVSLADAAALTIASQSIRTTDGYQHAFQLRYDPSLINSKHTYSLSARIEHDGRLIYINTTSHEVDLNNLPDKPLSVRVRRI